MSPCEGSVALGEDDPCGARASIIIRSSSEQSSDGSAAMVLFPSGVGGHREAPDEADPSSPNTFDLSCASSGSELCFFVTSCDTAGRASPDEGGDLPLGVAVSGSIEGGGANNGAECESVIHSHCASLDAVAGIELAQQQRLVHALNVATTSRSTVLHRDTVAAVGQRNCDASQWSKLRPD